MTTCPRHEVCACVELDELHEQIRLLRLRANLMAFTDRTDACDK